MGSNFGPPKLFGHQSSTGDLVRFFACWEGQRRPPFSQGMEGLSKGGLWLTCDGAHFLWLPSVDATWKARFWPLPCNQLTWSLTGIPFNPPSGSMLIGGRVLTGEGELATCGHDLVKSGVSLVVTALFARSPRFRQEKTTAFLRLALGLQRSSGAKK